MADNMKCSNCDKPATVHLTQIINNKIIKVDLCEECAQAKGVTDPEGFSLADLLTKSNFSQETAEPKLTCPDCGMESADFRRTGRLGCSSCFEVFGPQLRPLLEDMHVGSTHKGKVPQVLLNRRSAQAALEALENSLARAIAEEAYEAAAKYRDQINAIKHESAQMEMSRP